MIKTISYVNFIKHNLGLASLILASLHLPTQAANEPDLYLIQAFEGVWKMERSATTLLTDRINTRAEQGILFHEPQVKDAPIYLRKSYEVGEIEYRHKKYPANETPWGNFPHLNPDTMRLIEISIPQTRYLILSGEGESLFSATDWNRYRFLHVFDMGRSRYITNYYSVFAEAHLGERVLGRLPNSSVLNYARVVPAQWDANNNISGYEVLLYNLDRNGINRALENNAPISYTLTKNAEGPLWTLSSAVSTPVADELDRKGHYFTGARLSSQEHQARTLASQPPKKKTRKKSKKSNGKKTTAPLMQD
ncbi:hypothetical protein [Cellvibrio sp. OA-2007]|uniref:hypothetical protein n=1 Tax=Cellvibrio sp. OA-2007 TaxID=529823 RepID=UPI000AB12012|nr:hypothetical protein [Cellvibrio sp. OA-2007]